MFVMVLALTKTDVLLQFATYLAGIMWTSMLKEMGYDFNFGKFIQYTGGVGLASVAAALVTLQAVMG